MTARPRQHGFTLIEILVATVILAVMGMIAYRGIAEARVAVVNAEGHLDRLRDVQRAVQLMTADFRTVTLRKVREPIGDGFRGVIQRDTSGVALVELSRAGWSNGAGLPRGTGQRVVYRLEDGKLFREHWNVMDPTLATPLVKRELLDGVERVEMRYLTSGREWIAEWPQVGNTRQGDFYERPLAVEITLVLADYGEIRRLVEVPG
ncbi:MAG TPA: type II secretion system minor pseudopilin GspJ [Steroidobacteraceae bacterium]|nr:type II secretion system minor pseudopilin GspJ [Steroidobacteraceae bacterium]